MSEIKALLKNVKMEITVSGYLGMIRYKGFGFELVVDDPKLLWACSCEGSETSNCVMHNDTVQNKDLLTESFRKDLVKISCDKGNLSGLEIYWKNEKTYWPPSVDAFFMYERIINHSNGIDESDKTLIDLGCGSGFLGIALGQYYKNFTKIQFYEWMLTPLIYSKINYIHNKRRMACKSIRAEFIQAFDNYRLDEKNFEKSHVVVCNPPYLPFPDERNAKVYNIKRSLVVGGTHLLETLFFNSDSLGEKIYVQASSLAHPEIADALSNPKVEKVGDSKWVPFRIRPVFENPEYLQWLIDEGRLEKCSHCKRYRYWHEVSIYYINHKER